MLENTPRSTKGKKSTAVLGGCDYGFGNVNKNVQGQLLIPNTFKMAESITEKIDLI